MAVAEERLRDPDRSAPERAWQLAFEEAWPAVERSLRRVLRARHVPRDEWDDYLQEVAARALAAQVDFGCAADLLPWASTVLRRMHARQLQRAHRLGEAQSRLRVRGAPDVASSVIAKLDLDRVVEAVSSWSPVDREALAANAASTNASYVRRHRLRAKLLTVIDGLGAAVAGVRRARFRMLHALHAPQADQVAAALLTPAAVACVALVLPYVGGAAGDAPPTRAELAAPASRVVLATPASSNATGGNNVVSSATHDAAKDHGQRGRAGGGPGTGGGRPGYREAEVSTEAAGHSTGFRVEDERKDETIACVTHPPFGRQCVDYPVHVDDVRVDVPDLP